MSGATIQDQPIALPPSHSLSLSLPEGLSFDQWQLFGRELAAREKVLNWWIGDWWAFGEHRYGDRAKAAAEGIFPLSYKSLATYGSVARAFETSRRLEHLDFSLFQETAPLARQSPDTAKMVLERAGREHMTVAQVRAAVRAIQGKPQAEVISAREEDPKHYAMLSISRPWNRVEIDTRQGFFELMTAKVAPEIVEAFLEAAGDALWEDIDP